MGCGDTSGCCGCLSPALCLPPREKRTSGAQAGPASGLCSWFPAEPPVSYPRCYGVGPTRRGHAELRVSPLLPQLIRSQLRAGCKRALPPFPKKNGNKGIGLEEKPNSWLRQYSSCSKEMKRCGVARAGHRLLPRPAPRGGPAGKNGEQRDGAGGVCPNRSLAELAKKRETRKMQEMGQMGRKKKLRPAPLQTSASTRHTGGGGEGGRHIFGFIVIAGSRCPAIVYEHVNLTDHHLGVRTHTRETKHSSNIYNE